VGIQGQPHSMAPLNDSLEMKEPGAVGLKGGGTSYHPIQKAILLGRSYRVGIPWGEGFRQLMWLRVARDLSIILGTGEQLASIAVAARHKDSLEPLPEALSSKLGVHRPGKDFHFSFHTSGIINARGLMRTYRASHSKPGIHEFCAIDFRHPRTLRVVDRGRDNILLPWQSPPSSSLRGVLMATPEDTVGFFHEPTLQLPLMLRLPEDGPGRTLFLQFSLLAQATDWPEDTRVLMVARDLEKGEVICERPTVLGQPVRRTSC